MALLRLKTNSHSTAASLILNAVRIWVSVSVNVKVKVKVKFKVKVSVSVRVGRLGLALRLVSPWDEMSIRAPRRSSNLMVGGWSEG